MLAIVSKFSTVPGRKLSVEPRRSIVQGYGLQMSIYFVETTVAEQRELLCRWTERFYMEKKRVRIVVDSMAAGQFIDQLLWTFSQSSFIPHTIFNPGAAPPSEPVLITPGE